MSTNRMDSNLSDNVRDGRAIAWDKLKTALKTVKMLLVIALTASDVGSDMYSALSFFRYF